jgi:hypothetical protein
MTTHRAELSAVTAGVVDSVRGAFAGVARVATETYGTNTDPEVAGQVLSCIRENDKLHSLSNIVLLALGEANVSGDLAAIQ